MTTRRITAHEKSAGPGCTQLRLTSTISMSAAGCSRAGIQLPVFPVEDSAPVVVKFYGCDDEIAGMHAI